MEKKILFIFLILIITYSVLFAGNKIPKKMKIFSQFCTEATLLE